MIVEPVAKKDRTPLHDLFERIPGIIFMGLLLFLVLGGIFLPEVTAYFIIILNVYFFYKSFSLLITFVIAYTRIMRGESVNWQSNLLELENREESISEHLEEINKLKNLEFNPAVISKSESDKKLLKIRRLPRFLQKILFNREKLKSINYLKSRIEVLRNANITRNWREIQHIIIVPHVKEPEHILRETLENLSRQTFPTKQINVVLAAEARDPNGLPLSEKLAEEFKDVFNHVWVSNHVLQDDEIVGKSSNMKAGGKVAYDKVTELGWDLKKTIVTSCDADSKLPHQYFSYVTYEYVTRDDAEYKVFNAALVFYNNIWRLPFYARVKNSMSTIYNTARLVRVDKLIPFSTYSTSFWMIKEIGFWTPWVTPEDFHLFLKAQFKFGGIVNVVPVYLRIMSDAAEGVGHLDTIRNNYKQERRWSWGISDDGWVLQNLVYNFGKHDLVTMYRALHSIFDHIMSPVMGVVIVIGGNIPPLLNPSFSGTVLGSQLPIVSSTIITVSLVFMILIVLLDLAYRPKRPQGGIWLPLTILKELIEWIVLPVATFVLALLPGLEANTRLLFGKHLEYYVTKKQ